MVSEKLEGDWCDPAGIESFIGTWWSMLKEAIGRGHRPVPQVLHFVHRDPDGNPGQSILTQLSHDANVLTQIALAHGTFALVVVLPTPRSIAVVVEHPKGDRAFIGLITEDGLGERHETPDAVADRPRLLDAVKRSVQ